MDGINSVARLLRLRNRLGAEEEVEKGTARGHGRGDTPPKRLSSRGACRDCQHRPFSAATKGNSSGAWAKGGREGDIPYMTWTRSVAFPPAHEHNP